MSLTVEFHLARKKTSLILKGKVSSYRAFGSTQCSGKEFTMESITLLELSRNPALRSYSIRVALRVPANIKYAAILQPFF